MIAIVGILIFLSGLCFYLKVYYHDLLNNPKTSTPIRLLNIMTPYFSLKYLVPLKYMENDRKEIERIKKKGNTFLYGFYFFLLLSFLLIFLIIFFKV